MAKTILLIDDNDDALELMTQILAHRDYRILRTVDADQALDLLAAHPVDLIVCDIFLPGMDGRELLKRIRAEPDLAAIPVILISAGASAQTEYDARTLGAEGFLIKPFVPKKLLDIVTKYLDAD